MGEIYSCRIRKKWFMKLFEIDEMNSWKIDNLFGIDWYDGWTVSVKL